MKQTKDVTAIIIDNGGSYLPLAVRLAREYKRVYYCCMSWQDPYPKMNKSEIGTGIESIEVINNPWDVYDKIDLWIFPDVYFGAFQMWLVEQGEIVWGSRQAEELELNRDLLKEHMKDLGLPVNEWQTIKGIENLRVFLQDNEDVYVKINTWRGTVETFYSKNYQLIKPELDEIQHSLGAFGSELEFLVEQPVNDAVEKGYDGWNIDGKYPEIILSGVEIKDKAYAGKIMKYSDLSPLITDFNTAMADTFKNYGYRGFHSCENRIDKNKKSYMIDFTARTPCPPGEIYLEIFTNLGEVIWAGANGEIILPTTSYQWGVELLIESEWGIKNFQPVYYPKKYEPFIKLKKAMIKDGINYIIPQLYGSSDMGAVVGLGDTLEVACRNCIDIADSIEGNGLVIRKDTLDSAQEELNKFEAIAK
jgi:phosphoribosylamine-glycine ligase